MHVFLETDRLILRRFTEDDVDNVVDLISDPEVPTEEGRTDKNDVMSFTPLEVTAYFGVLNFPWVIKPAFGLVSDFVPLFGYRRTSYLLLASAGGAIGYLTHAPVSFFLVVWAMGSAAAFAIR